MIITVKGFSIVQGSVDFCKLLQSSALICLLWDPWILLRKLLRLLRLIIKISLIHAIE